MALKCTFAGREMVYCSHKEIQEGTNCGGDPSQSWLSLYVFAQFFVSFTTVIFCYCNLMWDDCFKASDPQEHASLVLCRVSDQSISHHIISYIMPNSTFHYWFLCQLDCSKYNLLISEAKIYIFRTAIMCSTLKCIFFYYKPFDN